MHKAKITMRTVGAAGLAALAAACAGGVPEDMSFQVAFDAAEDINPDASGRASPTTVKVYALAEPHGFSESDFFALFDDPEASLGEDLISVRAVPLQPGAEERIRFEADERAEHVGFVAAFRDIDGAQWRLVTPIRGVVRNRTIKVRLADTTIEIDQD